MARKEFVKILESNIMIMDKLSDKFKREPTVLSGYPRQQLSILVRLHIGGPARLKDIARRELVTAPNLCAAFRKLERDGLVLRRIDEDDRRNTWYSVTSQGQELAVRAMDAMRSAIDSLFAGVSRDDENALTAAMKTINNILTRMELTNA